MENKIEISKKILKITGSTNAEFGLIKEGDRVLLGLSGGKDSILLATLLARLKKYAPFDFEFKALTVDYGRGGEYEYIFEYCEKLGIPYELYRTDIYKILEENRREGSVYCSFCSRMRRGALYSKALEGGFNKIPTLTLDLNALDITADGEWLVRQEGYGEIGITFKEKEGE